MNEWNEHATALRHRAECWDSAKERLDAVAAEGFIEFALPKDRAILCAALTEALDNPEMRVIQAGDINGCGTMARGSRGMERERIIEWHDHFANHSRCATISSGIYIQIPNNPTSITKFKLRYGDCPVNH